MFYLEKTYKVETILFFVIMVKVKKYFKVDISVNGEDLSRVYDNVVLNKIKKCLGKDGDELEVIDRNRGNNYYGLNEPPCLEDYVLQVVHVYHSGNLDTVPFLFSPKKEKGLARIILKVSCNNFKEINAFYGDLKKAFNKGKVEEINVKDLNRK